MTKNIDDWQKIIYFLKEKFYLEEDLDLDGILFLIGVQELGQGFKKYKKDDKLNLIHIGVCTILEPYGYYKFIGFQEDGWPEYEIIEELPFLKANEQSILIKKAIINYFKGNNII